LIAKNGGILSARPDEQVLGIGLRVENEVPVYPRPPNSIR
jgi:hypothetical protein